MSERYEQLYRLPTACYREGAPLLVSGGALLRDSWSGRLLCQLKLINLEARHIRSASVSLRLLDSSGESLGEVEHCYALLDTARDESFGADTAILLPVDIARSFTVRVKVVLFADGSRWVDTGDWAPLPRPEELETHYGDRELAEQFRIRYGADCRYAPAEAQGLWLCTCGGVNHMAETSCHRCHRVHSALQEVPVGALRRESLSRLKGEQARAEQNTRIAWEHYKKRLIAAGLLLPLLFFILALANNLPGQIEQRRAYESAQRLLELGQFDEAEAAFSALGSYGDSARQATKNVPYQRALDLMARAEKDDAASLLLIGRSRTDLDDETSPAVLLYEAAEELFLELGNFRDSAQLARQCRQGMENSRRALKQAAYDEALRLLEERRYSEARAVFLRLADFEDSERMATEAVYRKALGLLDYLQNYDVRGIRAEISLEAGGTSRFALSVDRALALGDHCITDLLSACGEDFSDVSLTETPDEDLRPLADCVTELFTDLAGYRDSEDCLAAIAEATDYTREFYQLCQSGKLLEAYNWLTAYDGELADREQWLDALTLYQPYCQYWSLYLGDATIIALEAGQSGNCNAFVSQVSLSDGVATLRLDAGDYAMELTAPMGSASFTLYENTVPHYLVSIGPSGRFAIMKYSGVGQLLSSCEYSRTG